MHARRNRRGAAIAVTLCAAVMLSGCGAASRNAEPASSAGTERPAATRPAPSPSATAAPAPKPSAARAEEGFRSWLAASRKPDAPAACAQLAPKLQERMIAELRSSGATQVRTCEEMITSTAELYRSLNQSAEVEIEVRSESARDATLFVTYLDSSSCGTVVMHRPTTDWIITEQSEECAR